MATHTTNPFCDIAIARHSLPCAAEYIYHQAARQRHPTYGNRVVGPTATLPSSCSAHLNLALAHLAGVLVAGPVDCATHRRAVRRNHDWQVVEAAHTSRTATNLTSRVPNVPRPIIRAQGRAEAVLAQRHIRDGTL